MDGLLNFENEASEVTALLSSSEKHTEHAPWAINIFSQEFFTQEFLEVTHYVLQFLFTTYFIDKYWIKDADQKESLIQPLAPFLLGLLLP